jgi:hypothetical protein
MSTVDRCACLLLFHRHKAEIALCSSSGSDPCDVLVDVTAGWPWSEEVGYVVGYAVFRAVAECPVDDSIPGSATVVIGGSFSEVVDYPLERLVGDG